MFEEHASNVDWVAIFIVSDCESRLWNVLAALDNDPCGWRAGTMVAELFRSSVSVFRPSLRTPCEGFFLFSRDEQRVRQKMK